MRQSNKYHVAAIVYDLAYCTFAFSYRSRPCLMRRKRSARIIARALLNVKTLAITAFQVVHHSIPSLGLRPRYSTKRWARIPNPPFSYSPRIILPTYQKPIHLIIVPAILPKIQAYGWFSKSFML